MPNRGEEPYAFNPPVTSKRILIVDDEPANIAVLEAHLGGLGHQLIPAESGAVALQRFNEAIPDLVLLDLRMPGLDGIDVLAHIRASDGGEHVPVILVTAHGEREHRLNALEAGADEFLEKPIDGAILRTRVRTLLELKDSRDQLRDSRDQLASRNDALEQLQREQRDLIAFVVHDLKNPLAAVDANLQFLNRELKTSSEDVREALAEAHQSGRRLGKMIEDLLLISRLEEAKFPLRIETIKVAKLLRELVTTYRQRAEEQSVLIDPPMLADVEVHADRTLLQRVLENILDNALRHTPRNGKVGFAAREDGNVTIAVSNTGPSIPVEARSRIFDKFARGSDLGTAANAGLGLYFCRRAVEAHGGAIEVVETADWPTSFLLHLPSIR